MQSIFIKDIMIPLEDYATVSQDATLYEAVKALEDAQNDFNQNRYHHRAVLVYDASNKIVGKLSQLDILKSLEPRYDSVINLEQLDRFGINADYIRKMVKELGLLRQPVEDVCRKASVVKVREIMYTPTEGEYVAETATLNEAVLQLLVGHHQSLLVTRDKEIVGILRLTDVFKKICDIMDSCRI
jgi:CBS domain-containing protein